MNEERASREGPSRRSGGAGGAFGRGEGARHGGHRGAGRGAPGHGYEHEEGGIPAARGGRRRAGSAEPLDSADLAVALQRSVAVIGAAGPPRAGLTRIRRKAKARQRRRTVMAGGAGVLFMAMAVSVVTGNSFDIVPVLTSVVGLGGGGGAPAPAVGGGAVAGAGAVRTVRPTAGRKGPAIGPGVAAGTPTALAASGVGACTAVDLTTVASVDSVIDGVSYGHVEAVAQRACAVAGPPVLQVANSTANAASSVAILQNTASDGSKLPQVPTWGAVLVLQAGQGYDLQFAWAPDACPVPAPGTVSTSGMPSAAATGASGPAAGATPSAVSAVSGTYQLSYLVTATSLTSPVTLNAACGATVYVTDVYARGAYPLPLPDAGTPTPQPSITSAAPNTPGTTPPPSSAPPASASSSAAPTGAAGASPGDPVASPGTTAPANGASPEQAGAS